MNALKNILLPIGLGLGLLALLGLIGSALFLVREARAVDPILGWIVLGLFVLALYLLVLAPILRILALPKPIRKPAERSGRDWNRYLERFADRALGNSRLADWPHREELRRARESRDPVALEATLARAIGELDRIANEAIHRHAAAVFVVTGASQSGRLDAGLVLSTQIRMIREIAVIYYQRPGPRELWALYANVGGTAFLAGEIQDSELLAVLGAPVSAALSGFVPVSGSGPLVSLLVSSLLDGSANALLTLRVGVLARRHCGLSIQEPRNALARSASLEAAGLLAGVVAAGAQRIAAATRRLVVTSTIHAPQTAAKGVAEVGTAAVGELARAASRLGSRAWDLSREAVRHLGGRAGAPSESDARAASMPPADEAETPAAENPALQDAARFWERVAQIFAP